MKAEHFSRTNRPRSIVADVGASARPILLNAAFSVLTYFESFHAGIRLMWYSVRTPGRTPGLQPAQFGRKTVSE